MQYINTTFAHGNGPYCRCVEWAIEVNNVREERGMPRLPIVVPLVYPERQERILREEIATNISPNFLTDHPDEILFDKVQGGLLSHLMFRQKDYSDNLRVLAKNYQSIEGRMQKHLETIAHLETFDKIVIELDLRDCVFQLGLNNRMQTHLPNQFYTAGGAGPFDELLEKAINDREIILDKDVMKRVLPIARRMIDNQKIIFSNIPGVFSYDDKRQKRSEEVFTPPFIHSPKQDNTELPSQGIYLLMTGINGIRENWMWNVVTELEMQIYTPEFSIKVLPEQIRHKAIALNPSKINNPYILAQYSRAGWSCVWLSHLAQKGFITSPYQEKDDPEMLFNERSILKLGLGVVIRDDPRSSLEKSIELSEQVDIFNQSIVQKYGTLDGIRYAAEAVVNHFESL